jgi:peptide/nickel transport system permease protein
VEQAVVVPPPRQRPGAAVVRAFRGAPSGIAGLTVVLLIVLIAAFAPFFFHHAATTSDFDHLNERSSWSHLLGTDGLGRDVLARLLVATRLSMGLALSAAGIALGIGILLGSAAALVGRRLRPVLLRVIETMVSFPVLLTAIFVSVIVGRGKLGAVLGVGIALSFGLSRITATLALSVGGREYINAGRVLGVGRARLMLRYILPNIAEPLIVSTSIAVSASIVNVSALSFLGLGVQPPSVDWGQMLTDGVKAIYLTPAAALGPMIAIATSALAFGFTGEALARVLNPLLWTSGTTRRKPRASAVDGQPGGGTSTNGSGARLEGRPSSGHALDVRDLVVTFPGPTGPIDVVKGVTFCVEAGEVVGIVGESGSGKTMTALAVAQLTPYPGRLSGTVMLHGKDLRALSKRQLDALLGTDLAVVFQDPMSSLNPALRIGTQLTHAVRVHRGLRRRAAMQLAARSLREVHIPSAERQLSRYPHEFSGGMRQRAMIARGLMKEPSLLVADEPTTALDVSVQAQIMDLLEEVNTNHRTAVILISHNLALVSQNCDRVLVMYAGRIVEEVDAKQLATDPLHPYTRALLDAVPELGQSRDEPLAQISGEVPDIGSPPPGCPYHPRCPLAIGRCSAELPPLLTRPDGRRVACHVANEDLAA